MDDNMVHSFTFSIEVSNTSKQLTSEPIGIVKPGVRGANPPIRQPFTPVQNIIRNGV